jgi:hypothetical protein
MSPDSIKMKVDQTELENLVAQKETVDQGQADHLHLIEIEIFLCMNQSRWLQLRPLRHNLQCRDQVQMIPRE